jgi:hypothetical protein
VGETGAYRFIPNRDGSTGAGTIHDSGRKDGGSEGAGLDSVKPKFSVSDGPVTSAITHDDLANVVASIRPHLPGLPLIHIHSSHVVQYRVRPLRPTNRPG